MIDTVLSPRLVLPGAAAVYDQMAGEKIHVLLSAQETGGAFALFMEEVPPQAGPPLHIHHREDETFYVLEGELVVQLGEERIIVPAGCAAFLPRGVPHTFTNRGAEIARALVALTPGGLERFFAEVEPLVAGVEPEMPAVLAIAAKYGIKAVGPPLFLFNNTDGAPLAMDNARAIHPDTAVPYTFPAGDTIRILLAGEQTGGQLALLQGAFPTGCGAPLHSHQREDEIFYVLAGALTTQMGPEKGTAVAGAATFLPRNVPHDFFNRGEQTVNALAFVTPAGLENYFTETYTLLAQGELNEETMLALAHKYGLESG